MIVHETANLQMTVVLKPLHVPFCQPFATAIYSHFPCDHVCASHILMLLFYVAYVHLIQEFDQE